MSNPDWAPPAESTSPPPPQAPGLWPPGNYQGRYLRCSQRATQAGMPGISLWFNVSGREVEVWIKGHDENVSPVAARISDEQLISLGWNCDYTSPAFSPPSVVQLWMKHGNWSKRGTTEDWQISTFTAKAADSDLVARLSARASKLAQERGIAPGGLASQNGTAAATRPPVASGPPSPTRMPPPPAIDPGASTAEAAWAVWESTRDAAGFWAEVKRVAGTTDSSKVMPAQWAKIAAACPPF